MPRLHGIFLFLLLSYIAVPGTLGFPAELMMLAGIFRSHTGYGILASFVSLLNIACMLRLYRQTFQGSCRFTVSSIWEDLRPKEWLVMSPLLMILLAGGIVPQKLIHLGQTALHVILEQVHESGSKGEATSYALNIFQSTD
jgi:NADH-quinone oxidoreductase subunit M